MSSGIDLSMNCCICFERITPETCVVDSEGTRWNLCQECGYHETLAVMFRIMTGKRYLE